jgi:DNA modification methylase
MTQEQPSSSVGAKQTHTIIQGDVRKALATLPDESMDCVVTSPPYWGLRDYKVEPVVWDGVEGCEHDFSVKYHKPKGGGDPVESTQVGNNRTVPHFSYDSVFCSKCSAWKGQLGLEPTFQLYVEHIVGVFHEVKRVLKKTGSLYLNLGDTYSGSNAGRNADGTVAANMMKYPSQAEAIPSSELGGLQRETGLPSKCLIGIPERVMLAMIDDGLVLRNKIIWHKPNGMPSSVRDRFSNKWESVYFFVKSKRYYFDLDAVREPHIGRDVRKAWWSRKPEKASGPMERGGRSQWERNGELWERNPAGKNPGDVWEITTQPFAEAHFATFPEALPERCIKASCPTNGIVLDPFAGSGTTALVAKRLQKSSISIEVKPEYVEMIKRRIYFGSSIDGGIEWRHMTA